MRISHTILMVVGLVVVAVLPAHDVFAAAAKASSSSSKKKKTEDRILTPAKYNEVIDMLLDAATMSCHTLGELIKDPSFNYRLRCDLFLEQVEDLSGMTDSMVKEIKLTQKQMVENAIDGGYDRDLVGLLKKAAKVVLSQKSTTEKTVGLELSRQMSQWVLDVSVHEMGKPRKSSGRLNSGGSSGLAGMKLTPQQRESLMKMGVAVPPPGSDDDDERAALSEKKYGKGAMRIVATEEDEDWAEEVSAKLRGQKKRSRRERKLDEETFANRPPSEL